MAIESGFLRLAAIMCYLIAFCSAALITGCFAWFTFNYEGIRNVTALTLGVATLPYTVYKTVKACTAGIAFFGFTHTFLDIVYIAAMLAVAILSRPGASGCYQYLQSVLEGSWTGLLPCTAMSASFAMAILAALMLVFAIIFQLLIRAREKPWAHTSKA